MHKSVDNWGPLILIIKEAENGYLFGAFISQGLNFDQEIYRKDKSAFIFSLTKGTVHYQRNKNLPVVLHSKDYISLGYRFPEFNNWDDISLKNSCHSDYWSYSDFGWAFIPPEGMEPRSPQAQKYLAGSYRWRCEDI